MSDVTGENCTKPAFEEFPGDVFTLEERRNGAILLHFLLACYSFVLLAFVCDDYFVPSIRTLCERKSIQIGLFFWFLVLSIMSRSVSLRFFPRHPDLYLFICLNFSMRRSVNRTSQVCRVFSKIKSFYHRKAPFHGADWDRLEKNPTRTDFAWSCWYS